VAAAVVAQRLRLVAAVVLEVCGQTSAAPCWRWPLGWRTWRSVLVVLEQRLPLRAHLVRHLPSVRWLRLSVAVVVVDRSTSTVWRVAPVVVPAAVSLRAAPEQAEKAMLAVTPPRLRVEAVAVVVLVLSVATGFLAVEAQAAQVSPTPLPVLLLLTPVAVAVVHDWQLALAQAVQAAAVLAATQA
jgi:hypothetical protein